MQPHPSKHIRKPARLIIGLKQHNRVVYFQFGEDLSAIRAGQAPPMKPDLSTVNFCFFSLFIFPFYRPSLVLIDDQSSHTPIQGAAIIYIIRGPIQLLRQVGLCY
jgi:hypothetical protein